MADVRHFPPRQFVEVSADEWLESHSEIARCLRIIISSLELSDRLHVPLRLDSPIVARSKAALEKVGA